MLRFVDLRGQMCGGRFAWWDTVRDRFLCCADTWAWDTWSEFAADVNPHEYMGGDVERFRTLCPEWAFEPDPDESGYDHGPGLAWNVDGKRVIVDYEVRESDHGGAEVHHP